MPFRPTATIHIKQVSAHKKKKNKKEYGNDSEKIKREKIHTHKTDFRISGPLSHTHTRVATNNIPAGKFDKSLEHSPYPLDFDQLQNTHGRERERKKKDTKESGKA
jgi:hypothetical protein